MTQLVYLHGMPGSPAEWALLAPPQLRDRAFVPDRNGAEADFAALASAITARYPQGPITLIGFSLGAYAAIMLAAQLGSRIGALHLVSAAAPLQLGNFLPDMAGRAVFTLARDRPAPFTLLCRAQRLTARIAPGFLFDRLFASAMGADRSLRDQPWFRAGIAQVLQGGLGRDHHGFARELRGYVGDWRAALGLITAPVTLWHGTADNWSPSAMADALLQVLPEGTRYHQLAGQSHYSALQSALTAISTA